MADDPPPLVVHRLRLLSDQPVEGCELVPDVFMLNGISPMTVRLEYKWYRCMDKMACSWCGKTPVVLQRLTDQTYFCSSQCFVNAWPGHSAQHRTGLTGSKGTGDKYVPGQSNGPEASTEQKWIEVANTMSYTPQHEDIGHTLKLACTPYHPDGTKGIAKTLKTNYVIAPPMPPPPRRMLIVRNNVVVSAGKPGTFRTNMNRLGFTMLTYNCLAEIYATSEAYPYCPAWALPWNYRRRNILRELVAYHADVMCLQEVQADHFENFLEPELAKYSYAGLHKCKTREFMGQYGKMDGCAIFYRRDKFTLLPGGSLRSSSTPSRARATATTSGCSTGCCATTWRRSSRSRSTWRRGSRRAGGASSASPTRTSTRRSSSPTSSCGRRSTCCSRWSA